LVVIYAGYGVSDVENLVECTPASVMRIASISKPLTMVAVAQLWEQGKLDLDKPVQHYVPSWPDKVYKGQKVFIQMMKLNGSLVYYCLSSYKPSHCYRWGQRLYSSVVHLCICASVWNHFCFGTVDLTLGNAPNVQKTE